MQWQTTPHTSLTKYMWRDEQTSETHKGGCSGKKIKCEVLNQSQKKVTGNKPKAVESMSTRLDLGFQIKFLHLLLVRSWASHCISLSLNLFLSTMEIISQGCNENK